LNRAFSRIQQQQSHGLVLPTLIVRIPSRTNMKTKNLIHCPVRACAAAWTLPEVMIAVLVAAFAFASLYLGLAQGFSITRLNRENLRATQILAEKTETLRLYTWDQINAAGFVTTKFTNYTYPDGLAKGQQGITYSGTIGITAAPVTEIYKGDLKQVVITLNWTTGSIQHQRQMTTLVSRYGLQNYIYSTK
jgi:hypothetical protein